MPEYFDTNATTPVDNRVIKIMMHYLTDEFGNAGSRTHAFGVRASKAVEKARKQIQHVLNQQHGRIIFTSGATESNNLVILGLEQFGQRTKRTHIVSTAIEHKAVLEPLERLAKQGFEIEFVKPHQSGVVSAKDFLERIRDNTLLVSMMHVNNETGIIQPIKQVADELCCTNTLFHVDAAQGFGKDIETLQNPNIDFISISAHKIYGPKGIGALAINENPSKEWKIRPLMVGGGQEAGLRPGTLPVHLITGFGFAAELALKENSYRREKNFAYLERIQEDAIKFGAKINGDVSHNIGNVINISFPGIDSESAILLLKDDVAITNGAACTSENYKQSHVLKAMGLEENIISGALRISWYHESPTLDWEKIFTTVSKLH